MKNTIKFLGIGGMDAAVTKQTLHGFGGVLPQAKLLAKKSAWTLIFLAAVIGFSTASCETFSGLLGGIGGGQTTYAIGDRGPGGGIVFYDKGNGDNGWRYLEAAPADIEGKFAWIGADWATTHRVDLGSGDWEIGKGKQNTATILSVDPNAPASKACVDYRGGRLDDWFLPSRDEFVEMFKQNSLLNLTVEYYWTSTQFQNQQGQNLTTVYNTKEKRVSGWFKNMEWGVRPVRAFLTSKQGAPAAVAYAPPPPPPEPVRVQFEPAQNQPSPAGAWKTSDIQIGTWTFNANGTATHYYFSENRNGWVTDTGYRWSASGNRLTITYTGGGDPIVYIFEITGGTLKWVDSRWPYDPDEFTRQ